MSGHGIPSHEEIHLSPKSGWAKLPMIFGALGVVGLGAAFATSSGDGSKDFYFAYLTSLMFWLALGLGGLFFVLIQHATRAGWSIVVRRLAENVMLCLVPLGILALPVAFLGTHDLFHHWADVAHHDAMLKAKAPYLNESFFQTRAIVYVIAWIGLALLFWRWSTSQDSARDPVALTHKMRFTAPLAVFVFALTLTFGAFDWLMSLDPHWFSTIFGVYYFAGCVLMIHAFLAVVVILLHRSGYLRGVVTPEHFHDLGKMMFAFTVFWAYIGFSQYMLIWYASIPEETHWFSYRGEGSYLYLSLLLPFVRFVFPFLFLMSRKIKRNPKTLMFGALWVMAAQIVDMYWLVHPALANDRGVYTIDINLADIATFVGIGGVVLATFTWALGRSALVPTKDPRLEESINFENF